MARANIPENKIDWSWFTSLEAPNPSFVTSSLTSILLSIPDAENVSENEVSNADITELIEKMTGVSEGKLNTPSEWYNSWQNQQYPGEFSFTVLAALNHVDTARKEDFISSFENIAKFFIYRLFTTPIPSGFPNAGSKPLIVSPKSEFYSPVLDTLYEFFWNNGIGIQGIGNQNIFPDMCKNFTRDQIASSEPLMDWCGCFSPDDPITTEKLKKVPGGASFTKQCDPLCKAPETLKLVNPIDSDDPYVNRRCEATVCIMDKFTIKSNRSHGVINLNQTCPCVEKQACYCIIDSSIETDILNKIGSDKGGMSDPIVFQQVCPGALCLVTDPDSLVPKEIECNSLHPAATAKINQEELKTPIITPNVWFLFGTVLVAIILLVLCARHIGYEPKYKIRGVIKGNLHKSTRSTDMGFLKKT